MFEMLKFASVGVLLVFCSLVLWFIVWALCVMNALGACIGPKLQKFGEREMSLE